MRIESTYSWLDLHIEKMKPILRSPVDADGINPVKQTESPKQSEVANVKEVSVSVSDGREQSVDAHYSRRVDYSVDFTIVHQV